MVGNDQKPSKPGHESSGAKANQDDVPPDTQGGSQQPGGSVEGGGVAEGTLVELADKDRKEDKEGGSSDFVNYVAQRVGGKANVFQTVWAAMMQEAPAYLLDEKKPIKLGFGELYALPYRANWREIMQARFPRLAASLSKTPSALREPFLINIGWDAELFNSDLVEMKDGDKQHGWCVIFAPNEQWFKIVRAYEKNQRTSLGARKYATRFTKLIRRFTKRILKYFLNHVTQTTIPAAAVRHGTGAGGDYLVPYIPKGKVRPTAPEVGATYVVSGVQGKRTEEREEGALYGSFKEVPPMPLIPSSPKDLWEREQRDSKQ
jgi:hypothetical protein